MTFEKGQKVFYGPHGKVTIVDGPFPTLENPIADHYEVRLANGFLGTAPAHRLTIDRAGEE